jgi:hypothetical protein
MNSVLLRRGRLSTKNLHSSEIKALVRIYGLPCAVLSMCTLRCMDDETCQLKNIGDIRL